MTVADVLIPAYNAEATIAEAVCSIQRQTVRDIRIVVVDDGSTDRTGAILADIAAADPRVLVVSRANGGIVDALNEGLRHCTAPILTRHDADDLAYPHRLERQLAYLDARPDCVAVGGNVDHIDAEGRPTGTSSAYRGDVRFDPTVVPADEPFVMHPMLAVRRAALDEAGGYRHAFHAEDVDLYWRLTRLGALHNLPDRLGAYRVHDGSITRSSIINARTQALMAQLAAIDHRRREAGRPGLAFPSGRRAECAALGDLSAMVALDHGIDAEERAWLEIATVAKLLENAFHRNYALEPGDYAFLTDAMRRHLPGLRPADHRRVLLLRARQMLKLVRGRQWRDLAREGVVLPRGLPANLPLRIGATAAFAEAALYQGLVRRVWRRLAARRPNASSTAG